MVTLVPMRNLRGVKKSSLIHQSLMSATLVVLFQSSIASTAGDSLLATTSFTSTATNTGGAESLVPAEPLKAPLARQLSFSSQVLNAAFSSTTTSEKPSPSVIGYQELL